MSVDRSVDALLARRATALARPVGETSEIPTRDVVVMSVAGGKRYAVATRHVQQVVRNEGLCRLPGSSTELLGLLLVKGEAVPVADLASVLGLTGADHTRQLAVVLDDGHSPVGLLVDEVLTTARLPERELRLAETDGLDAERASVELGITTDGVVLLDGALLLSDPRLDLRAAATATFLRPATSA